MCACVQEGEQAVWMSRCTSISFIFFYPPLLFLGIVFDIIACVYTARIYTSTTYMVGHFKGLEIGNGKSKKKEKN